LRALSSLREARICLRRTWIRSELPLPGEANIAASLTESFTLRLLACGCLLWPLRARRFRLANVDATRRPRLSTVTEIESALKELPLEEAQKHSQWLQKCLDQQTAAETEKASAGAIMLPDYAARRRMILGDKVLPNVMLLGREQERW
jgi:hypothetical protein